MERLNLGIKKRGRDWERYDISRGRMKKIEGGKRTEEVDWGVEAVRRRRRSKREVKGWPGKKSWDLYHILGRSMALHPPLVPILILKQFH